MRRTLVRIEDVADRDNLVMAFRLASRGKRHQPDQRAFAANLDAELEQMRAGILTNTITVGSSRRFVIHDPKRRTIHAPVFRERVLHHALMRHLGPVLDTRLIHHTYACRIGGGQFAALDHAQRCAIRCGWFLQLDVRGYFDAIPHEPLLAQVARIVKGDATLALLRRIITAHATAPGCGLPIGALTSQHLANRYLDPIDRLATEVLRVGGYVRYMDDLVVWGDRVEDLQRWHAALVEQAVRLGLAFKPAVINRTAHGVDLLGWRVFPGWRRLDRDGRQRLWRRWCALDAAWEDAARPERLLAEKAQAAVAWARNGETGGWRRRCLRLAQQRTSIHRDFGWRPSAPPPAPTGSTAAVAGTTTPGTAARRTATGTSPATGTTTLGSGSAPSPAVADATGGPVAIQSVGSVYDGKDGTDPGALVGRPAGQRERAPGVALAADRPYWTTGEARP